MDRIEVTLTFPPSVNELYFNTSADKRRVAASHGKKLPGRLKTKRHMEWRRVAGYELNLQHPKPVKGRYFIHIGFSRRHDVPKIDLSNHIKAVEDLLVAHGLIEDDGLSEDIRLYWDDALPDRTCFVQVGSAEVKAAA